MSRRSRMKDAVLEVLLFKVGGASYGVALGQVRGLVRDLPHGHGLEDDEVEDTQVLLFDGRDVPVFPAHDLLNSMGPASEDPREAIIFDDGCGLYGVSVDATEDVIEVTPGNDLYALPPQEITDLAPCRAWGVLTVAERPVILLDMRGVAAH